MAEYPNASPLGCIFVPPEQIAAPPKGGYTVFAQLLAGPGEQMAGAEEAARAEQAHPESGCTDTAYPDLGRALELLCRPHGVSGPGGSLRWIDESSGQFDGVSLSFAASFRPTPTSAQIDRMLRALLTSGS